MKKIFLILILSSLILIAGCMPLNEDSTSSDSVIIGKLVSDSSLNNYVKSAGYYEGGVILTDITTNKDYSIFVCTKNRSWAKLGDCYQFNPKDIQDNIDMHKYSAELSGCYIGEFKQVEC